MEDPRWAFNVHFIVPIATPINLLALDYNIHRFQSIGSPLEPPKWAYGASRVSQVTPKHDFSQCFQLHFYFRFLCSNIHEIIQTSNRKQKVVITKRSVQFENVFLMIRAKQTYIATTDIKEIRWLYHIISYISAIAMYAIWPELSGKRFSFAEIALKPSVFAVWCLFRWFHACLSIENENKNIVESIAKNCVFGCFRNPAGSISTHRRSQAGSQLIGTDVCHSLVQMNSLALWLVQWNGHWRLVLNIPPHGAYGRKVQNDHQTGNYFWPNFFLFFTPQYGLLGSGEKKKWNVEPPFL